MDPAIDHVVVRIAAINRATFWAAVVRRVHHLQRELASIALIPLVVLPTFGREHRLADLGNQQWIIHLPAAGARQIHGLAGHIQLQVL